MPTLLVVFNKYLSLISKGIQKPHLVPKFLLSKLLRKSVYPASIFVNSRYGLGQNIFDSDWDCLIILDTCRPDALEMVSDEYDFISSISKVWSVGADSSEWMANTFRKKYIEKINNTAHYTSNPNAVTVLENQFNQDFNQEGTLLSKDLRLKKWGDFDLVSETDFADYKCLHKEADYGNHYPDPRSVTNHGIRADREKDYDKLLLHYMPPHGPYISEKLSSQEMSNQRGQVRMTEEPRNNSFEAYLDNLRWGLDEVELLLNNIDRDNVVITADHGEYFGKWFYGHLGGQPVPSVRVVPWIETEAEDSMNYQPSIENEETHNSVEERLEALGYK